MTTGITAARSTDCGEMLHIRNTALIALSTTSDLGLSKSEARPRRISGKSLCEVTSSWKEPAHPEVGKVYTLTKTERERERERESE